MTGSTAFAIGSPLELISKTFYILSSSKTFVNTIFKLSSLNTFRSSLNFVIVIFLSDFFTSTFFTDSSKKSFLQRENRKINQKCEEN